MSFLGDGPRYYTLDADNNAVGTDDVLAWSRFFEDRERRIVKQEWVAGVYVSTVFLGLDHAFGDGPPLIFETMAFGASWSEEICERCSTWKQAQLQHAMVVASLIQNVSPWRLFFSGYLRWRNTLMRRIRLRLGSRLARWFFFKVKLPAYKERLIALMANFRHMRW